MAVDAVALRRASEDICKLRDDVADVFRYAESGRLLARAVSALALAGDKSEALALLDELRDEEKADRTASLELVEAVMTAEAPEIARTLLPAEPHDEREQLAAAHVGAFSKDEQTTTEAVKMLDRLLESTDEAIRSEAAFAREVAALDPAVSSSVKARSILESNSPVLAAVLAGQRLYRAGQEAEATALLLPHQDDVRVLRALVLWAGRNKEWDRVVELSHAITSKQPEPLDRLILADALHRTGERQEAITELTALRRDANAHAEIRNDAYALSAQIASAEFELSDARTSNG